MNNDDNKDLILKFIKANSSRSSKEINEGLRTANGYATIKRVLTKLASENLISRNGKGKETTYVLSPSYEGSYPIDVEKYLRRKLMIGK